VILIDSSVWIDFLASTTSAHQVHLSALIRLPDAIGLPGPVIQEVLQGIREEGAFHRVADHLKRFPVVHASTNTYVLAARLYRMLGARGLRVPAGDLTVAAITIESNHELYTLDRHFQHVAQHSALRLYRP
jgi:predicted nucleic acid-binding protein